MTGRGRLAAGAVGAVVALVVVGVLALVGVFDSGDEGGGRAGLPTVSTAGAQQGGSASGETWLNRVYEQGAPAVVFIQATVVEQRTSPFGDEQQQQGVATGTGFLIDAEGRIVTNAHVVEGARQVQIRLSENELVDAQVVGTDVSDDLALLKVDPARVERVRPLPLGDSDAVRPGDAVAALGNPLGLQDTITAGIVSAKQRTLTAPNGFTINDVIQTDAAVNPGNSGGPLLDQDGRVIGINSQIATAPNAQGGASTSEGFIGIAFAIPVNTAKEVIRDLEDDGRVDKPYLGVNTVTLTQGLAQQLGIDAEQGALVVSVAEGGPAAAAGLRGASPADTGALTAGGDVIVRFGDRQITSSDDLGSAIADTEPGQTIALRVLRDGRERTVRIRLATRPTTTG